MTPALTLWALLACSGGLGPEWLGGEDDAEEGRDPDAPLSSMVTDADTKAPSPRRSSGWTRLRPGAGARVVYVSSSQGDDGNDGLSATTPVATLAAGYDLLRDGEPDWLVLRSGDVWHESFPSWQKSARSESDYMVVSSYGRGPRPEIDSGDITAAFLWSGEDHAGLAFVNLALHPTPGSTVADPAFFVLFGDGGHWNHLLFEGNHLSGYGTNLIVEMADDVSTSRDVQIRRNVIVDAHSDSGHSHGVYMAGVYDWLVEENLFANNSAGQGTIFSHATYFHETNGPGTSRGNLVYSVEGEGDGGYMQDAGGVIEDNLAVNGALGFMLGRSTVAPTEDNVLSRNVVLGSRDISDADPRGLALILDRPTGVSVEENLVLQGGTGRYPVAFVLSGAEDITLRHNVVSDWVSPSGEGAAFEWTDGALGTNLVEGNTVDLPAGQWMVSHENAPYSDADYTYSDNRWSVDGSYYADAYQSWTAWQAATGDTSTVGAPSFVDPGRDLESYLASLGRTGGVEEFFQLAREQRKGHWSPALTAAAVNDYLREGYQVVP